MKSLLAMLAITTCLSGIAIAAPLGQAGLTDRLTEVVREHFPDAQVSQDNGNFTARHGTMVFTIHRRWKTGEIQEKTAQVEGPNFKGFILSVSVQDGKYGGQAAVPQTLREPYWQTYLDCPPTEDGKGHYAIKFSFGSRLDKDFMKAVFDALPKSRTSAKASNATSDAASSAAVQD